MMYKWTLWHHAINLKDEWRPFLETRFSVNNFSGREICSGKDFMPHKKISVSYGHAYIFLTCPIFFQVIFDYDVI